MSKIMSKIRWDYYSQHITENNAKIGDAIYMAPILSINGALGSVIIIKSENGFILDAYSETTGKSWKSPDTEFKTIQAAKNEANKLWKPAYSRMY